jgi:hypothetical protein
MDVCIDIVGWTWRLLFARPNDFLDVELLMGGLRLEVVSTLLHFEIGLTDVGLVVHARTLADGPNLGSSGVVVHSHIRVLLRLLLHSVLEQVLDVLRRYAGRGGVVDRYHFGFVVEVSTWSLVVLVYSHIGDGGCEGGGLAGALVRGATGGLELLGA